MCGLSRDTTLQRFASVKRVTADRDQLAVRVLHVVLQAAVVILSVRMERTAQLAVATTSVVLAEMIQLGLQTYLLAVPTEGSYTCCTTGTSSSADRINLDIIFLQP